MNAAGIIGAAALGAAALTTSNPPVLAQGQTPTGQVPLTFEAPHHNRDITGAIWYPATGETTAETFAENGVFYGVTVLPNAVMQAGEYPVVMLSHGMGGHYRTMAWLLLP